MSLAADIAAKAAALPPERRADLCSTGVCQLLLDGEEHGEVVLDVAAGGPLHARPGRADAPDCVMEATAADFRLLLTGDADPVEFFYGGRIRARGEIALGMQLASALLG